MKTIWKYKIDPHPISHLGLPLTAKILSVQAQPQSENFGFPTIVLWAEVDTEDNRMWSHRVRLIETGKSLEGTEGHDYIGTLQLDGGSYVLHVYISRKSEEAQS